MFYGQCVFVGWTVCETFPDEYAKVFYQMMFPVMEMGGQFFVGRSVFVV
jgi:hypothetical protein